MAIKKQHQPPEPGTTWGWRPATVPGQHWLPSDGRSSPEAQGSASRHSAESHATRGHYTEHLPKYLLLLTEGLLF